MKDEKGPGYSQIDNKTLEKLARCKTFSRRDRVLFVIIRLVNGYLETKKEIRVSVIAERTGIEEANVRTALRALIKDKIIVRNGNCTGIIGAVVYKENGRLYMTPPKRSYMTYKGVKIDPKKGSDMTPYKENLKEKLLNKGFIATPLSRKEIDNLDDMEWFKAEMINDGGFGKDYIEKLIKNNDFHKLMSCWYRYIEASNIKNKEGFFLSLLEKSQEEG